ncbi:MAG: 2-oxo acid dehydrogenase subunit E2 [Clostridia bacterium]|nr:2-oxo acid dehydrogenase subunit E2 [Clostridia bacterium]
MDNPQFDEKVQEEYIDDTPNLNLKPEGAKISEKELKEQEKRKRLMKKKRFKDRKDGRLLRSLDYVQKFTPYVMRDRCDSLNMFTASINVTRADKFCREKQQSGMNYFTILHLILAAYTRTVAEHPAINRFVSGRRVYARRNIEVNMIVKKEMTKDAPETGVKVWFDPADTVNDVYQKFNDIVRKTVGDLGKENGMDKAASFLTSLPRCLMNFIMFILRRMEYHGTLPKALTDVSPFHGSLIITSMGSLGIPPVYHHIYNFGNLPIFISYGIKQIVPVINKNGETVPKKIIELKITMDERIASGYELSSAFKSLKHYLEHPELLEEPPKEVLDDIY